MRLGLVDVNLLIYYDVPREEFGTRLKFII
jgi:hypothetical protein